MRTALVMTFIGAAALSTAGQTATAPAIPCAVRVAPVIRGIKLGMTTNDVLMIFPGSRETEMVKDALTRGESHESFGLTSFLVFPSQYSSKERFSGISSMNFLFVDGRLVQYGVAYDGPPWPHSDDFINKIASVFKLPSAENWIVDQGVYKAVNCDGFRVRTSVNNSGASISVLTGEDPFKIQTERRAAAEEKQRQDFRP